MPGLLEQQMNQPAPQPGQQPGQQPGATPGQGLPTPDNRAAQAAQTTAQNDLDTITGTAGVLIGTDAANVTEISDAVWDETLTGSNHNNATSAGRRLRQLDAGFIITEGTADAGSTSTTINLETGVADGTTDNIYSGDRVTITAGTGAGEHGLILSYASSTQIATMSKAWVVTPDATSEYILIPADVDVELWNDVAVTGDGDWANVQTDLDTLTAGVALTAAGVDAIWDEDIVAAHNTADTAGAILNNILPEKNAAFNNIEYLWVAASDHVTPVTGATTMSVTRSLDGGAFGSGTGTGPTEVGNGIYQYDASAADMNATVVTFRFVATGGDAGAPDDAFVTIKTSG